MNSHFLEADLKRFKFLIPQKFLRAELLFPTWNIFIAQNQNSNILHIKLQNTSNIVITLDVQ